MSGSAAITERGVAAAALVLLGAAAAGAAGAPQIDDRSLARITAYAGGQARTGTGFLIETGNVVTAYHVVQGARRIDVDIGGKSYRDVEVIAVRPEVDMAILRGGGMPSAVYYRIVDGPEATAGTQIYVHGLPLGFDHQLLVGHLTQSGYLASGQWTDRQGRPLFVQKDLLIVPLDITSESGVSGAPVLDESGRVFGVFSGSLQEGGRGYSWAVPMQYARVEQMQQIRLRASAMVTWPSFPYLRPGLMLLRSLNPDSEVARIAQRCRQRTDDYAAAWEAQLDTAYHASMKIQMARSMLDGIVQGTSSGSLQQRLSRARLAWPMVEPQLAAFNAAQLNFERATAQLLTACFSQTAIRPLMPHDLPATRQNEIYDKAWGRRLNRFNEDRTKATAKQAQVLETKGKRNMDRIATLAQDADSMDQQQALHALENLFPLLQTMCDDFLSADQAEFIAGYTRTARNWAELIESMDLHAWETEHRTYPYRGPGGVRLSLANGWLDFDRELREALLAPGKTIPDYVKLVNFGPLASEAPHALAEVYWLSSYSYRATDPSAIEGFWTIMNTQWQTIQQREGIAFTNGRRNERRIGGDVQLDLTGDGKLRDRTVHDYLTMRFSTNGTATVSCLLLSGELGSEHCTSLIDSLQMPR